MFCQALRIPYFGKSQRQFDLKVRTFSNDKINNHGFEEAFFEPEFDEEGERKIEYECPYLDKYVNY